MKRANLPWRVDDSYGAIGNVVDSSDQTIVQTQERMPPTSADDGSLLYLSTGEKRIAQNEERQEVARLVVKAVNNHDQLVRTCKDLIQALERKRLNDGERLRIAEAQGVLRGLK